MTEYFAEIEDTRSEWKIKHNLQETIVMVSTMRSLTKRIPWTVSMKGSIFTIPQTSEDIL